MVSSTGSVSLAAQVKDYLQANPDFKIQNASIVLSEQPGTSTDEELVTFQLKPNDNTTQVIFYPPSSVYYQGDVAAISAKGLPTQEQAEAKARKALDRLMTLTGENLEPLSPEKYLCVDDRAGWYMEDGKIILSTKKFMVRAEAKVNVPNASARVDVPNPEELLLTVLENGQSKVQLVTLELVSDRPDPTQVPNWNIRRTVNLRFPPK